MLAVILGTVHGPSGHGGDGGHASLPASTHCWAFSRHPAAGKVPTACRGQSWLVVGDSSSSGVDAFPCPECSDDGGHQCYRGGMLPGFWASQWPQGWTQGMLQRLVVGHRASAGMPGGEGVIWALCSQFCRKARRGEFLLLQNAGALGHSPRAGFPTTRTGREEGLGCRARDAPPAVGQEYNVMLSLGCWSQLASSIAHYRMAFCR